MATGRNSEYVQDLGSGKAYYAEVTQLGTPTESYKEFGYIKDSKYSLDQPLKDKAIESGAKIYTDDVVTASITLTCLQRSKEDMELFWKTYKNKRICIIKQMNEAEMNNKIVHSYIPILKVRRKLEVNLPGGEITYEGMIEDAGITKTCDLTCANLSDLDGTLTGNIQVGAGEYIGFTEVAAS